MINTQELCRPCHHVDIEVLPFGPLPIHELKNEIAGIKVLEQNACDLEQRSAQMWRATFGDAAGFGIKRAGLKWWCIHAYKSYQSALVGEAAHIADLSHKLRAGDLSGSLHRHNDLKFRRQRSQAPHLSPHHIEHVIDSVEAVHRLSNKRLGAVVFGKSSGRTSGSIMNFPSVGQRKTVSVVRVCSHKRIHNESKIDKS